MIRLTELTKEKYDVFMNKHFINGVFIFNEETLDKPNDEEMLAIVNEYRLSNYTATEAAIALINLTFSFIDSKPQAFQSELEQKFLSHLVSKHYDDEETLLNKVIDCCYYGYNDIIDYSLDELDEMKYRWRY